MPRREGERAPVVDVDVLRRLQHIGVTAAEAGAALLSLASAGLHAARPLRHPAIVSEADLSWFDAPLTATLAEIAGRG